MSVVHRTSKNHHLTRLHLVSPSQGDLFYMRALLLTKSARSFEDLRTIDDTVYETFQEAAKFYGLFVDE